MDSELNDHLTRIEKMVSDNNRMLTKLHRGQRNAAFMRIVYWLFVIAMGIAAWYLIQPYLTSLTGDYNALTGKNTPSTSTDNTSSLMNLIDQYTGSTQSTTK